MAEIPNRPNPLNQYSEITTTNLTATNTIATNITGSTLVSGSKVIGARLVDQKFESTGSFTLTGSAHVGEIHFMAPTGGTSAAFIVVKLKTGSNATTCGVYSGSLAYVGEAPIA